jgi:hypothetical protein
MSRLLAELTTPYFAIVDFALAAPVAAALMASGAVIALTVVVAMA